MDDYAANGAGPGCRRTINGLIAAAIVSLERSMPWTLIASHRPMTRRIAGCCDFWIGLLKPDKTVRSG